MQKKNGKPLQPNAGQDGKRHGILKEWER